MKLQLASALAVVLAAGPALANGNIPVPEISAASGLAALAALAAVAGIATLLWERSKR